MENVPAAPLPTTPGYGQRRIMLNARHVGSIQNRERAFTFGVRNSVSPRFHVETDALEPLDWCNAVLASGGIKPGTEGKRGRRRGKEYGYHGPKALAHAKSAQGLPDTFLDDAPFTAEGKFRVIGNGVPLPMGRAVAKAVRAAIG
jgi:DNA (cytosine-5)-methyltransferase 1